jgi:prepilin-type N-terminal cleavage/methylation domain-containing protein
MRLIGSKFIPSRHPARSEGSRITLDDLSGRGSFASSRMTRQRKFHAFSLIEVIVAVAVFAVSITVILALLPALTGRGVETADRLVAARLPDALQAELTRLAAPGFDALAGQAPVMGTPLDNGLAFVATRDGARLHSRDYLAPASGRIESAGQYFLIECWRFADGPLRFDAPQSSLALSVRVSWPYRLPGTAAPTPADSRHELTFTAALNR